MKKTLAVIAISIAFFTLIFYVIATFWEQIRIPLQIPDGTKPDREGFFSLVVVIVVLEILNYEFKAFNELKKKLGLLLKTNPLRALTACTLLVIGLIGVWLAVRTIGLFAIKRYLLQENYNYFTQDILLMVAFILTANLCFTLIDAFTFGIEIKSGKERRKNKEEVPIKQLVEVAIQAVIIAFITFIPKYEQPGGKLVGEDYVVVILGMMVSVIVLLFARKYSEMQPKKQES